MALLQMGFAMLGRAIFWKANQKKWDLKKF